jgi:ATP phosphoribosyltransferase
MSHSADSPLTIAVPSKGRLQDNAFAFFARAGLPLAQSRGNRDYRAKLNGVPDVEVLFLSASEITAQLAAGAVHLGITGEDLIRETIPDADQMVELLTPLGFGQANVVVAVPQAWIDVRNMHDLDEVAADMRVRHGQRLRVATKYIGLTRQFFARKGLADYKIVESLGATEGAPASGAAEIIVDITTTGATLAANGLKVLEDGVILRSEANLVASLSAAWGERARMSARTVLSRIAAEETARTTREVRAILSKPEPFATPLPAAFVQNFEAHIVQEHAVNAGAISGSAMSSTTMSERAFILRCPYHMVFALVEALLGHGAVDVSVSEASYVFEADNPLVTKLLQRIG